jgi:hypothetical protein
MTVVTSARFEQGMTLCQYVDRMSANRERFVRALDAVVIRPEDERVLARLERARKLLVITEDWCGASLAHLPFVARLIEGRPDIELRVFLRDENPDLMDQYLKKGLHRSIPVFVFFDESMNELARFIETRPS